MEKKTNIYQNNNLSFKHFENHKNHDSSILYFITIFRFELIFFFNFKLKPLVSIKLQVNIIL